VFETTNDIFIPYFDGGDGNKYIAIYSLLHEAVVGRVKATHEIKKDVDGLAGVHARKIEWSRLAATDQMNPRGLLGLSQIDLPDHTVLRWSNPDPSESCLPINGDSIEKLSINNEVVSRKSLLTYSLSGIPFSAGSECGGNAAESREFRAHYSSVSAKIFITSKGPLFVNNNGGYLLTNFSLEGPKTDAPMIMVDYSLVRNAINENRTPKSVDTYIENALKGPK
jgi:hypothetical protein